MSAALIARARGIRTMLKPHVWLRNGHWCGEISMTSEADWEQWFDSYRTFIMHYARFAETHGIGLLCIGTELQGTHTTDGAT